MPAGWAAGAAALAGAASSGVQASSGKLGAEAASGAQLEGLGQANDVIREAMAQYGPRAAGGNRAYGQLQNFYGQGGANPTSALTSQEKKRLGTLQKRLDAGGALSSKERSKLNQLQGQRSRRKKYAGDSNLAESVGQEEEQGLKDLESSFGKEEEEIFGQQQAAQDAYTARQSGLDTSYKADVGALDTRYAGDVGELDTTFKGQTGALDAEYGTEEKALRDKISAGDVTIDPGYKFRLEQGQLARERGAAARGGLLSGGYLKDLEEYSQGQASQEFGAATGRLYDLYGLGKGAYTQKRGNLEGDYERGRGYKTEDYTLGRGYKTGDYTQARDYGRQDYGDLRSFYGQNLEQKRGRFDRRYGQGQDQRNFSIDRFGRRVGGAKALSDQGFDAMGQQSGLAGSLANLYTQAGQARGAAAQAGPNAIGQGVGGALNDLSFLAALYGPRGRRQTAAPITNIYPE